MRYTQIFTVLLFSTGLMLLSCGKKDETSADQKTGEQQQLQQNQQTTQNPGVLGGSPDQQQTVNPQTEQKKEPEQKQLTKEEEKKIEEQKRLEEEKKKKQDPTKPVEIDQTKPQNPDAQQNKEEKKSGDIDFSEIWKKRCVKCHGMNGKGKVEGVPDLTRSETKNKSLSQLVNVIKNGKPAETEDGEDMPAFKNKLTEEEIQAAAKFVKGL
ncbi:MAG: cytochrome c [Ignavibacteria bacterium]|nr:cytochrome c [Ignavibacteria bacterium]